ncbi:exonuclease mut-7 homolog [Protopterus annectens]|uniref:exonuclease mut-7 homolog n=1 Tax=Protopterus annectens TaxID=7888 RepID=UPI001CFB7517|nr:exonuclease mut-7 homolog [Protopterus annectens]
MTKLMKYKGYLPDTDAAGELKSTEDEEAVEAAEKKNDVSGRDSPDEQNFSVSYNPNCQLVDIDSVNADLLEMEGGASLQIDTIPPGILETVNLFYCCSNCGKIFWEGSHFQRVISQFKQALNIADAKTFYEV